MVLTPRRRLVQRRLVAIPIGVFVHLLLDGIWTDTQAFWWPFAGLAWSEARLPELARGPFDLVLEVARRGRAVVVLAPVPPRRAGAPAPVPAHRPARPRRGHAMTAWSWR